MILNILYILYYIFILIKSWYPEYGLTQILIDLQILLAKPCMDYFYNVIKANIHIY